MRLSFSLALPLLFSAAAFAAAAEKPALELVDEGLPLQEIRPLDRHVYLLTLEGKWNRPSPAGTKHYVNILFANGKSSSHRIDNDTLFAEGELRCVLIEHELIDNDVAKGGDFVIVVSKKHAVDSASDKDVISNEVKVSWPLDRPIVSRPPRTRHSKPEPIDAFPYPEVPQPKAKPPIKD